MRTAWLCPTADPIKGVAARDAWAADGCTPVMLTDGPIRLDGAMHADRYHGYPWAVNLLASTIDADAYIFGSDDCLPMRWSDEALEELIPDPDKPVVVFPIVDYGERWATAVLSRGACRGLNMGSGPLRQDYRHFYADQELWEVAGSLGIRVETGRLSVTHKHWSRAKGGTRPVYMAKAAERWEQDRSTFDRRKASGFPGHALLCSVPDPA